MKVQGTTAAPLALEAPVVELMGAALESEWVPFPELQAPGAPMPAIKIRRSGNPDITKAEEKGNTAFFRTIEIVGAGRAARGVYGDKKKKGKPDKEAEALAFGEDVKAEMRADQSVTGRFDRDSGSRNAALYLIEEWRNLPIAGDCEYSRETALALLGFCGWKVTISPGSTLAPSARLAGEHYLTAREMEALAEDSPLGRAVGGDRADRIEFLGPLRGPDGRILTIPKDAFKDDEPKDEDDEEDDDGADFRHLSAHLVLRIFKEAKRIEKQTESRKAQVQGDLSSGAAGSPGISRAETETVE